VTLRTLILNQPFYPDVVATAQHAADLAQALVARGHDVTVLCSARAYDKPEVRFAAREKWNGVQVIRVGGTGFGKVSKWKRAADFASFMMLCAARVAMLPRFDVVVAMTTPPLISVMGALLKPWKASRLVYWSMDLNPDEAIAAGYLRAGSRTARVLKRLQRFSLRNSDAIVALDEFMRQRIVSQMREAGDEKGAERVEVIAPWSHDSDVRFDRAGRDEFRAAHGLTDKFVVMYAGNHSPCHPLDTLMKVAKAMRLRDNVAFVFVGGGSEQARVAAYAKSNQLKNVRCLPYQPREKLAAVLSAADLHTVVMGDPFVGIIHPCKIYNILAVGTPFLYIGPPQSHIGALWPRLQTTQDYAYWVRNGDAQGALDCIVAAQRMARRLPPQDAEFSGEALLPRMVEVVERSGETVQAQASAATAS
jgi:glycosyltransferase involved in cell wall biosynthesis